MSFNPLHCGAVVASRAIPALAPERGRLQSPSLRGSGRFSRRCADARDSRFGFNPLLCGAVVASLAREGQAALILGRPSIPFIAGQWSLLRTSWTPWPGCGPTFNPLHCGAVVASPIETPHSPHGGGRLQSPSLRGSGRFATPWRMNPTSKACLNPLHCGAVVASNARSAAAAEERGLNPLHCGAVVASRVSTSKTKKTDKSQSPSLRGSGRFQLGRGPERALVTGLNPLHCGAVVASISPPSRG